MTPVPPPSYDSLTPAQRAVVDHDEGAALVFAVAGAGKTTALIHRVERLVREGVFAPAQILATSFGKGNERDLRRKLAHFPHCASVQVQTMHALGRRIILLAQEAGHWPQLRLRGQEDSADLDQRLLNIAINEARQRQKPWANELEAIDRHDFISYVATCKGNLHYPDLAAAALPPEAQAQAAEAEAPNVTLDWYLDLFRLYEQIRLHRGEVTFTDMLLTGWESLVRFPDILQAMQEQIQCVLVDEFQDINRAQALMLDLITAQQHNYMAIGDDDQTIYEWRGASPDFILGFEQRYNARRYVIDDNFRCPAGPLVLANNVIANNRRRAPKRLQLTRGFSGETTLDVYPDAAAMARSIVNKITILHKTDIAWRDMAILVRLNAQTPHIEQRLIAADVPFRVSNPFYNRYEIRILIHYVRLAWVEWLIQTGNTLNQAQKEWFAEAWQSVYNRPKRYLSRPLHDLVATAVTNKNLAPTQALAQAQNYAAHNSIAENIDKLIDDLAWLAPRLHADASSTLRELEIRLDYKSYLLESSGFPQTGEGRAAGVDALTDYAAGHGSLLDFVKHLRDLSRQRIGDVRDARQDAVTLSTIHGAKGLEWPVVLIAGCNSEIMPFNGRQTENMEEERRLFYVALTRASRHLHLYAVKTQPLSPFLAEAGYRQLLPALTEVRRLLRKDPATWRAAECCAIVQFVSHGRLYPYFRNWWSASESRRRAITLKLLSFLNAVDQANAWHMINVPLQALQFWRELAQEWNVSQRDDVTIPDLYTWLQAQLAAQSARQ